MYIAMAKPIKGGRINIRIAADLKDAAEVLAAMDHKDLTGLITHLLNEELKSVLKHSKSAYDDAAERLARAVAVKKVAHLPATPCVSCGKSAKGGLCSTCRNELIKSPRLAQERLNDLPFGALILNEEGTIITYNKAEGEMSRITHKKAIGKNFFTLAPCADVQEFHGRYDEFLKENSSSKTFPFVYNFKDRTVGVTITFTRLDSRLALVTAQKQAKARLQKRA